MALKKTNIVNASILLVLALVIFLRAPVLLISPSLFDEEGWYFKYAYENSFFKSLTVVQPDRGYFELFTNTTMAFASLAPLKAVPTVCAFMAFFAQLIPLAIVLWGRSFFFDTYVKKIIVSLLIIFVQSTGQIWITARHSQFFLLLATFLILINEVSEESKLKVWAYRLLLLFGGLAGVTSCYLTPIYILRAVTKKYREHTIQAAILVFTSCCQIAIVTYSYFTTGFPMRFNNRDFYKIFLFYLMENYLYPIFGYDFVLVMLRNMLFVVPVAVFLIWMIYKSILDENRRFLALGMVFSSILIMLTSLEMTGAERYMYAPGVMLMVLVFSYIEFDEKTILKVSSVAAVILTVMSLATSMTEYRARMNRYVNVCWPDWKTEVSIWERNQNYPMKLWPQLTDYKPYLKLKRHE